MLWDLNVFPRKGLEDSSASKSGRQQKHWQGIIGADFSGLDSQLCYVLDRFPTRLRSWSNHFVLHRVMTWHEDDTLQVSCFLHFSSQQYVHDAESIGQEHKIIISSCIAREACSFMQLSWLLDSWQNVSRLGSRSWLNLGPTTLTRTWRTQSDTEYLTMSCLSSSVS